MGTAHAEVGVIQQAYEKGMTNGKDMLMSVVVRIFKEFFDTGNVSTDLLN